jgi:hypothetical protein
VYWNNITSVKALLGSEYRSLTIRAFTVWCVLMLTESANGILRAILLVPQVGDFRARQIGVFTGSLLILAIAYLFVDWIQARSARRLVLVGLFWLVLTLLFEIGLGRFVAGRSWPDVVSDFDLAHGGLLPIGLAVLTFSPLLASRFRNRRSEARVRRAPASRPFPTRQSSGSAGPGKET